MPAGDYTLTTSNDFGCSKTSKRYHIEELPPTKYPDYAYVLNNTCAGQNNGNVSITPDALVQSVRWVNGSGQTLSTANAIGGLAPDTYMLYLTDQNGCETLYRSYIVLAIGTMQITSAQVTDEQCSLNNGSIKNVQVLGGTLPYNYSWLDHNGSVISTTPDLQNVGEGTYTLKVKDSGYCNFTASQTYQLTNTTKFISAPAVNNVQLCTPGEALLTVNNSVSGIAYRLYGSITGTSPIDEQNSGQFKINAANNTTYFITALNGSCESDRTAVQVIVGISAIGIANTITPNGDGINDSWKINSIENYPAAVVQVFSRYGEKVFESKGYSRPFDGTYNGKLLPAGVYYYIINLNTNCNLLSGSLTIIR